MNDGSSIKDLNENNAELGLPLPGAVGSLGYNKDIILDTIRPQAFAATVDGHTLQIIYNKNLKTTSIPSIEDFVITIHTPGVETPLVDAVTNISITDNIIELTLNNPVLHEDSVRITYNPGETRIEDATGNDAAAINSEMTVNNNTPDVTPPLLVESA